MRETRGCWCVAWKGKSEKKRGKSWDEKTMGYKKQSKEIDKVNETCKRLLRERKVGAVNCVGSERARKGAGGGGR